MRKTVQIAVHCAHDALERVADLKPHPGNPNKHPDSQIALLAKIIKGQGWRNPIVVSNRSGLITKGHARLAAAKLLGATVVPVDRQDYASDREELADMVADNRIAELAEPDRAMLRELAEQLDTGDFDMDLTGFDQDALEELMTAAPPDTGIDAEPQIDKAEELRKKWGVERGQIWELGDHRLMCGDSTSVSNGEKHDLVFTDPPYGIAYQGLKDKRKVTNDDLSDHDLISLLVSAVPKCPVLYLCSSWQNSHLTREGMAMIGMPAKAMIVWDKVNPAQNLDKYFKQHELIFYSGAFGGQRTIRGDVWQLKRQSNDWHPTTKPVELVTTALSDNPMAKKIYDPFVGSGTTIIACEQLGRKCRAMEIDPGYVAVSIQRWTDATGKTPRLLNGK